ncbi:MAG: addiction module toxin RelE [Nanoarchaeota archaeon]|nr:addiction module toxin RelE [Nanoarchaeota archaeon]
MTFDYILSDELEDNFKRVSKKDKQLAVAVGKKIDQIINLDKNAIEHFKNLKGDMKEYKRVHVGSFVLIFNVQGNLIVFDKFLYHDNIYK